MIQKIDESKEFRMKVGDKLIYVVDRIEDHHLSNLLGVVFKAVMDEKIDYRDFLKITSIAQSSNSITFNHFLNTPSEKLVH